MDEALLVDVTTKLNSLKCTARALEPIDALEKAQQLLAADRAVVRQVHLVTDFRERDWTAQSGIGDAIKSLGEAEINVNIARVVPDLHGNLAVTRLVGLRRTRRWAYRFGSKSVCRTLVRTWRRMFRCRCWSMGNGCR